MTVQELINELNKVQDKNIKVLVKSDDYDSFDINIDEADYYKGKPVFTISI